jgi:hypothetical protein
MLKVALCFIVVVARDSEKTNVIEHGDGIWSAPWPTKLNEMY